MGDTGKCVYFLIYRHYFLGSFHTYNARFMEKSTLTVMFTSAPPGPFGVAIEELQYHTGRVLAMDNAETCSWIGQQHIKL